MKRSIKYSMAALALVVLFAAGAYFVNTSEATYDPASVWVTLFKTELLETEASAPVVVFDDTSGPGSTVDIVNDANNVFGQGQVAPGTYNIIRFTVKNLISFREDPASLCNGVAAQTVEMLIDPGQNPTAQVPLYFATPAGGGTSGWVANGSQDNPFLMINPIEVVVGLTSDVELMFHTAGTVKCNGSVAELDPPTIAVSYNIIEEAAPTECTLTDNSQFWFNEFSITGQVPRDAFGNIVSTDMGGKIMNSTAVTGWGTIILNAPDSSGSGTWYAYPGNTFQNTTTPGSAEHLHHLAVWDESNIDKEGYLNPSNNEAGADNRLSGTYDMNGQKIRLVYDEGFFEGAITQDCKLLSLVQLQGGRNALITAIRKADPGTYTDGSILDNFSDNKYALVMKILEIQYDGNPTTVHNTTGMNFGIELGVMDLKGALQDRYMGWRTAVDLRPQSALPVANFSIWTVERPWEKAQFDIGKLGQMTMRADGLFNTPGEATVMAFGVDGTGLMSGISTESESYGGHRLMAGLALPLSRTPSFSDIAGNWSASLLEQIFWNDDGIWGNGIGERISMRLTYGDVTINPDRSGIAELYGVDPLTGEIVNSGGPIRIYGPVTECYWNDGNDGPVENLSTLSADCANAGGPGVPGISIPVFLVNSVNPERTECTLPDGECPVPFMRFALDDAKRALTIWSSIDQSETINNEHIPSCSAGQSTLYQDCLPNINNEQTCDPNVYDDGDPDYCWEGDPSFIQIVGAGIKLH